MAIPYVGGLAGAAFTFLSLLPARATAQVPADSAGRPGTPALDSSAAGYGDSSRQAGVDTPRSGPPADSARQGSRDSTSAAKPPAAPAPVDSVLSSACSSTRGGAVAPGLLLVVFRDGTTDKERSAAVTAAGGASAGAAPMGGEYVRPDTAGSARDLADQLVLNPAVASVSERSCP